MATIRLIALDELQPSQLYVSRAKLAAVLDAWSDRDLASLGPVPVKRRGDRTVLTDGHTRALAAYREGCEAIPTVEDVDVLDDEAYDICVAWCLEEGIESVAALDARVVDAERYEVLWLERCRQMHRELAARRPPTGGPGRTP